MKTTHIILTTLVLFLVATSCKKNEQTIVEDKTEVLSSEGNWKETAVKDIFGDDTDSIYNEVKLDVKLPTGIRGGSLPAIIKTDKNFGGFYMVISPNESGEQVEDYGTYLILWFKPEGGTANKLYLALTTEGYRTYNCIADLEFCMAQKDWVKNHTKVRFKGFTTDDKDAEKFVESPNGIDRDGADVYINPEFSIQY